MHGVLTGELARVGRVVFITAAVIGSMSQTEAGSLTVSWTAPTTNADGTPLTDLAGYRVYADTVVPVCPGGPSAEVVSPTSAPGPGQTVSTGISGVTGATTYFARVTAVDRSGNESACSPTASGVAHADIAVSPASSVSFGTIATGTTVDRTFTVQNSSPSGLWGAASVGAPYTIASGGTFSLAPGASQAVVVRFQPTVAGSFAGNVTFAANGDTVSRGISGTATGATTSPVPLASTGGSLSVFITQPTSGATVDGSGVAVLWVEGTSGSSNTFTLSVDGVTMDSQTTSIRGPVMLAWSSVPNGTHTLASTVRDAAGNTGSTSITVSVTGSSAAPLPAPSPPPTSPSTGTLSVYITQPGAGATVADSGTVVLWVEGTSGASNTFALSVDGMVVDSQTTSTSGPVGLAWTSLPNGAHTLTGTVGDASGNTGTTSVTVSVAGSSAPSPPPPPANDTLAVAITQPTDGTTVGGTTWVVMWVEGTSGSPNTFALLVDGVVVGTETTAASGPVTVPWTTSTANGTHTLMAFVRDAAGNTGRTSLTVTVQN
jgi:hypothetical protein